MQGDTYLIAQQSLLGAILLDPEHVAGPAFAAVRDEDLRDPDCMTVFKAARELFFDSGGIDIVLLSERLGDGSAQRLIDLMKLTPTAVNYAEYAALCRQRARMERAREAVSGLLFEHCDFDGAREAVARASMILSDTGDHDDAISLADMVCAFFDRHTPGTKPDYLPWGLKLLDTKLQAELGDFCILGGYPSAGKSLLAVQIALHMARSGLRVGYFSLETAPRTKLADRIMAHTARVPLPKIKLNDIGEADMAALTDAGNRLSALPIEFFQAGGYTVADIEARTLAKRYQVVVIDYLQLISDRHDDMRQRVTAISIGLHTMAQRHGVAVIALSQLVRPDKTGEKPKRPTMSSLKESGQLEQDADEILLLYCEDPDDRNSQRRLQMAKNKEGTVDSCLLDFDGALQTFADPRATWKDMPRKPKGRVYPPRDDAIPGQGQLVELADGEGGEIPF